MSDIIISLPDGSSKSFDHAPTILEVAESIGPGLAKATLGGQVNGDKEILDLRFELKNGDSLNIITTKSPEGNDVIRHSTAHLLAQAVQEIWPEVKVTIGPVIDNGFYYDFDSPITFSEEDLAKIEKKMKEIAKRDDKVVKELWDKAKAIEVFGNMGERFKVELIEGLDEEKVGVYRQGEWFDLCRGPHVQSLGVLKNFKLLSTAGAYWRGDENNAQLQRIYGTAFADKKELKEHLHNLEEAKKRDHRKIGKELGLVHFSELSPAAPFFTAKGTVIYNELQNYLRVLYVREGYQEVITPQIFDVDLYKTSGHYDNYRDNMYFTKIDERDFSVKPMNCPGHCVLFGSTKHSYRELPVRIADFGRLHRYERSGAIHGLTRVRTFCQDDAHIFCTMEQMQDEIRGVISMLNEIYNTLGMPEFRIYLSTRPEKRMGSDAVWDKAEAALEQALKSLDLPYDINPGDGAFYGPKLDIVFVDALKRPWQLGTLQADFNLPEAFNLSYTGEDNQEHQPVMLHRAILGSLERFIGVYLEHTAGKLPTWLSPTQVRILNVSEKFNDYCETLEKELKDLGVRVEFDRRNEKLGYKIREAQLHKVPFMFIVGDQEKESGTVSVRYRDGEQKNGLDRKEFYQDLVREISERRADNLN